MKKEQRVLVKHKGKYVWARVRDEDKPFWGLFGKRYLLHRTINWQESGIDEQIYFNKFVWQVRSQAYE